MAEKPLVKDETLGKAVKVTLDIGVPGFSRYMDREYQEGALHTLLGLAAGIAMGPLGVWLVAANSISRSTTGIHLWEHLSSREEEQGETRKASTKTARQ